MAQATFSCPCGAIHLESAQLRFPRRHKLRIPRSGHAGQNSFTSLLRLSPPRGARRGPQCENCARSLAPQGHFRAHSVGLGAPPLPTARGAAGAPFRSLPEKKTGRARFKRKGRLGALRCSGPPRATRVGVSVQAPIWAGLRARLGLLQDRYCRPVPDGADLAGVQERI